MENNLVETIFEAITIGDETMLENCLDQATIDTVLEFRRKYDESPLHLCVKIGGVSHLGVLRRLLASELVDTTTVDSEGQTVLECALSNGENSELVDALIKVEIDGLDDATACYKMLRHDSLEVFKNFLQIKQLKEDEEFQHIASALIQLNVKNVVLSEDLRHFVLWKLSDYGFRKLSGNWSGMKDPNEWKNHIDVISECWRVINEQYNTRLYTDVDDLFLHRLQTVHNHLYFLKHKQFLAHLPMQEAIFCVAIFLSIHRNPERFLEYRLMMNKCLVIEFVRMVSEQLAIVKTDLEVTATDLLSIVKTIETLGTAEKNKLIEDLLMKMESSNLPNKAHVIQQLKERAQMTNTVNKDSLIKDMLDKVKKIDKPWTEEMAKKVKALDKTYREQLSEQIKKRLHHVSHPQNVVNRLMGDWKKGKAIETIVAEIVSDETFTLSHLMRVKDRRIKRKLLECYNKTKQYYSLRKIVFYCEEYSNEDEQSTYAEMASMKRVVQVFGEAIKNTANSPNMPGKTKDAVESMLTGQFPILSKSYREAFSHTISLKNMLLGELFDKWVFQAFRSNYNNLRMVVQLLYVVAIEDVRQSFYDYMRQCDTFEKLRSLVLYVEDMMQLEKCQAACYKQVTEFYIEAKATFEELANEHFGVMPNFQQVYGRIKLQHDIVNEMSKYFEENKHITYSNIRKACLSSDDLDAVRRLLNWKQRNNWAGEFFQKSQLWWSDDDLKCLTTQCDDKRFLKYFPLINVSILQNGFVILQAIEKFEYIEHTRQLTHDLKIADKIDEEALQDLNMSLKSYYDDIFTIDKKWNKLETFCKERKLPWNKELTRKLVKRDQDQLQQLYDSSRNKLREILKTSGLDTVDGLVTRLHELPFQMRSAIEYIQLELCEMLRAVGYFGDSFHYLRNRIPMIQGINYRNLLAHDSLSYNLLTDSSMEKIAINAFVFANTEVQLFDKTGANKANINVPTLTQTNHWVDLQKRLLEAFKTKNVQGIHTIEQEGGEVRARFCCVRKELYLAPAGIQSTLTRGQEHEKVKARLPTAFFKLSELINPCNADVPVVEYLNQYFAGFLEKYNDPKYQVSMALTFRDFQAAYDRAIARGDCLIPDEMFDWEELMPHIRKTNLLGDLVNDINNDTILIKFIEHGNKAGVEGMLPYFENFHTANRCGPLENALFACVRSIADLLLPFSVPHRDVLVFGILLHWNDIFVHMMEKTEICEFNFAYLLKTTILTRNYTAAVYLLENDKFTDFIPYAFVDCCETAAGMGELSILQHLLERGRTAYLINNNLVTILHQAALKQQWHCIELLLECDVPVDELNFLKAKNFTFLTFVKYGRRRLLRKIKPIIHEMFGTNTAHPLTVAIINGTASKRMIRSLRSLGFDCFDSPTILHAAIKSKNQHVLVRIQKIVNKHCAVNSSVHPDHFRQGLIVLQRWKMISFVEESKAKELNALFYALHVQDEEMVKKLFGWARQMRTLDNLGILGGIVFEREAMFTSYGKRNNVLRMWNTRDSCKDMIARMKTCAKLGKMEWQQFTLHSQSFIPITFYVLTIEDKVNETFPHSTFALRDKVSLEDNLKDFLSFVNVALSNFTIIFAKFSTADGATRFFWQIEEIRCMYDILPPSENGVDLTDLANYVDLQGDTLLHHCVRRHSFEMVKLLVENGANPLLMDGTNLTSIATSLLGTLDYSKAVYLLDECVRRDLRNENGCSVLELRNPDSGDSLIHTAILVARQDIVQRLLKLRVDAWVLNYDGVTPAHLAGSIRLYNVCHIVKMILDYDASQIDKLDKMNNTLLQCAVAFDLLKLVQLILNYKPNLLLRHNGMTALGMAIVRKHIECAKCLLNYAIENNIQGITLADEDDHVLLSLFCNDYDLSKMLLEYELGHKLEEIEERDFPRINSILEGCMPRQPDVSMALVVQEHNFTKSQDFLQKLRELIG